jgi:hypothetical protein
MTVPRRISFEPNGSPTSLQDSGSGDRGPGMCDMDQATAASKATAIPSLSKVSQRGAASLVSRIVSVTYALTLPSEQVLPVPRFGSQYDQAIRRLAGIGAGLWCGASNAVSDSGGGRGGEKQKDRAKAVSL